MLNFSFGLNYLLHLVDNFLMGHMVKLTPRMSLECKPEIPVAPGEQR